LSVTIADAFETIDPPPDGEPNPLKDLAWIKKALLTVIDQQKRIIDMEMRRLFSVKDLADRFSVSLSSLYNSPWRLPNFGKADVTGPNRWWGRTCDTWYSEPEADRKRRWEAMGSAERRRAMGAI
jgi:hypothetical protein